MVISLSCSFHFFEASLKKPGVLEALQLPRIVNKDFTALKYRFQLRDTGVYTLNFEQFPSLILLYKVFTMDSHSTQAIRNSKTAWKILQKFIFSVVLMIGNQVPYV